MSSEIILCSLCGVFKTLNSAAQAWPLWLLYDIIKEALDRLKEPENQVTYSLLPTAGKLWPWHPNNMAP